MNKTSPLFDHYFRPMESLQNESPDPTDWAAYAQSLENLLNEEITIGEISEENGPGPKPTIYDGEDSEPDITEADMEQKTGTETSR